VSDRFYFVDLDFFHKRTCSRLKTELGPWGVVSFLALIAEAKRGRIPGTLVVTSEPDFWKQLGLYGDELGFDMDAFLRLTGRLKQTSRRRVGRLLHVVLTNHGRWQKDARRQNEREQKASKRRASSADKSRKRPGHRSDKTPDRELEVDLEVNPPTPLLIDEDITRTCPLCPHTERFEVDLEEHCEREHELTLGRARILAKKRLRAMSAGRSAT
jgi:hypothetical protein